jgi:CDP-glucose 4,6-dehydratase
LAAQPLVRRSYQIPAETFEINATGTANLLEALTSLQNKCTVILVTTDKIYHNKESFILYKEEDRLGGYDPYSASKACAELIAEAFRSSFFNKEKWELHHKSIVTVRAGNVIGGGDWSIDRLVPDVVRSLIKGEEIQVRNPKSIRPWQHVLEPLGGYLLLGALLHSAPGHYSNAYNFGPLPDDHLSVKDLVQRCLQFWGNGSWCDHSDPNQPHEAGVLMLNIAKAMEELKWHPKWNATQSIKNTIEWYKQPLELAAETTYNQIEAYLSL